jgi:hypothetical protein
MYFFACVYLLAVYGNLKAESGNRIRWSRRLVYF